MEGKAERAPDFAFCHLCACGVLASHAASISPQEAESKSFGRVLP